MILDECQAQLVADGVAVYGTDLFCYRMPDEPGIPDLCVAIVEYPGPPSEMAFGQVGVKWERPRVQFSVRGPAGDAVPARTKCNAIRNSIAKMANAVVAGTTILEVAFLGVPIITKWDDDDRPVFTFNVQFKREVPAGE
jgi:hypothetical protein